MTAGKIKLGANGDVRILLSLVEMSLLFLNQKNSPVFI